jgi:hypothetical protein
MNTKPSQGDAARLKGITAVHCFNGTAVTPEEHKKLINGPIAVVHDIVEDSRKRIDSTPRNPKAHALVA